MDSELMVTVFCLTEAEPHLLFLLAALSSALSVDATIFQINQVHANFSGLFHQHEKCKRKFNCFI